MIRLEVVGSVLFLLDFRFAWFVIIIRLWVLILKNDEWFVCLDHIKLVKLSFLISSVHIYTKKANFFGYTVWKFWFLGVLFIFSRLHITILTTPKMLSWSANRASNCCGGLAVLHNHECDTTRYRNGDMDTASTLAHHNILCIHFAKQTSVSVWYYVLGIKLACDVIIGTDVLLEIRSLGRLVEHVDWQAIFEVWDEECILGNTDTQSSAM